MAVVGPAGAGPEGLRTEDHEAWYACAVAEFWLAFFVVGALLVVDPERLRWISGKVRDLIDWFSS